MVGFPDPLQSKKCSQKRRFLGRFIAAPNAMRKAPDRLLPFPRKIPLHKHTLKNLGPLVPWSYDPLFSYNEWNRAGSSCGMQIQFEIVNNVLLNHPFLAYICKPTCWVSRFDFSSRTCSCWDPPWSINDPDPKLVYKVRVCSVRRHLFSWENLLHLSVLFVQYDYTTLQF